ncbi:MAG: malonyl-CoA decarboxylase family protein, partial [Planctomycetes bacterium]|nr:malonyl-CoA decarboxylase family protein [Planctomycetota bacterium]
MRFTYDEKSRGSVHHDRSRQVAINRPPLPRFRKDFLDAAISDGSIAEFFTREECKALIGIARVDTVSWAVGQLLSSEEWEFDEEKAGAMRAGLLRAARHYLANERKNGRAVCPVAHFHCSNGALLARINWLADTSETGISQSAGLMVNYRYRLRVTDDDFVQLVDDLRNGRALDIPEHGVLGRAQHRLQRVQMAERRRDAGVRVVVRRHEDRL